MVAVTPLEASGAVDTTDPNRQGSDPAGSQSVGSDTQCLFSPQPARVMLTWQTHKNTLSFSTSHNIRQSTASDRVKEDLLLGNLVKNY